MTFVRPKLTLIAALLLLIVAACAAPAAEPTAAPTPLPPTAVPATDVPPTDEPEPTEPPDTAEPEPTDEPQPTEAMEEETEEEAMEEEPTAAPIPTDEPLENKPSTQLQQLTASWNTDWSKTNIRFDEILSGGPPRDGIPSVDEPKFIGFDSADAWLVDHEPVISVEIDGQARAYPIQILTWHEIVNDTLADVPILVTFCPLCNSAIVFDRRVDDQTFEFGTSGLLRKSDLIMYDRTTETLWQQFTGTGIVGELTDTQLTFLASSLISYADFKAAFPDGEVLSQDTGFLDQGYANRYGRNPYTGYDNLDSQPFLFDGDIDGRLQAMERVVTVGTDADFVAYPVLLLQDEGVVNDTHEGEEIAIFHVGGTASALGASIIAEAEDVGATGVFSRNLDGQLLTFSQDGDAIIDNETGSVWNIVGQAIDGSLAGSQLDPIIHADHFWFSWAAFRPDTRVYSQ